MVFSFQMNIFNSVSQMFEDFAERAATYRCETSPLWLYDFISRASEHLETPMSKYQIN